MNTARPIDNYNTGIGGDSALRARGLNWAGWVGDQDATFEGLVAALDNMLHSAEYGYVAFGSTSVDIRKMARIRSRERRSPPLGPVVHNPIMENGGSERIGLGYSMMKPPKSIGSM